MHDMNGNKNSQRLAQTPIIELEHVGFNYHGAKTVGRPTLQEVSFSITRGKAIGLIGESGSGKSTIAKLILGLASPSEGAILFNGQKLMRSQWSVFRRRVQPIFQNPMDALDPRMNIGDQLMEPLIANFRLSRAERRERIADALSSVGLPKEIARKLPRQISGGQAQRATIARALILDPDVLICDEAVSALDMTVQAQILNLLNDLREEKQLGILFISHDIRAVSHLCSEIVVLRHGRLVESGPKERILSHPIADYTKTLLSAVPNSRRCQPVAQVNNHVDPRQHWNSELAAAE
ncbi:ATP-binding cassette domain-containing protein [Sinorhizobium medicae]|uniref:ABC transporter ATP-binding protein n=1 Tax=Sinorhizobium medicae TaxID=110321 RepID=UPI00129761D8|nr:ABC transporter ATP-binding protein [Sinorhizobium medicae]MDX0414775.1 ATP-binding cassette domain-containing protein [Sinorhizobium medicae]MDX0469406.1 ATP-binding cassette domain-containing protein [Sinorhizobium medicae]MDX0475729.1 ATP-binding cassette domain-containing protein [Sinorhizobium medicae]MDX0900949.1 ATP-binding cassette domain-containing protein [Sinorhizobium medicae]MDX1176560.1 ATP-binding cassette domain-containing protein [Sinorhizobium medicae]